MVTISALETRPARMHGTPAQAARKPVLGTALAILGVLVLWQAVGQAGLFGGSIPSLTAVLSTIAAQAPLLWKSLGATASRALLGGLIGISAGLAFGVLAALFPKAESLILRGAIVINAVPIVALGPILMTLPGARPAIPVVFAALAALFSTIITVSDGFRSSSPTSRDVFRVFGAGRWNQFFRLKLPTAVPLFVDAIRLAIPAAVLGALLGEWFGVDSGLGVIMISSMRNIQYELLWSAAVVAVLFSMVLYGAATLLDVRVSRRFGRSAARPTPVTPISLRTSFAVTVVVVIGLVVAWQYWITANHIPRLVAPAPLNVVNALTADPGAYLGAAALTTSIAIGGLLAGAIVGLALAVILWLVPALSAAVAPLAVLLPTVPIVIFIPILGSVLGYGVATVFAACIIMAFFPVYVLAASGLTTRPPGSDDIFAVYGASRLTVLVRLALPAAVPSVMLALRLSAANCFLIALSAEWLLGQGGLGRVFSQKTVILDTGGSWAAVLVSIVLALAAYGVAVVLERVVGRRWA
ncbi:ABC transporter permease [Subtercola endophyticus]|uniref:ABC transporter permease n=1 Tax=Subtercola endophyticus TaxID=2895559 RepID=UPI001E5EA943|nr:ABC transporter permease subunit [Subtercola endophyticus]UFS60652.1 ABC transporter permease subunit [Subtercola endophyticus]